MGSASQGFESPVCAFSRLDELPLVCNIVCPLYFLLFCIVVVVYSIKLLKKQQKNPKTTTTTFIAL